MKKSIILSNLIFQDIQRNMIDYISDFVFKRDDSDDVSEADKKELIQKVQIWSDHVLVQWKKAVVGSWRMPRNFSNFLY